MTVFMYMHIYMFAYQYTASCARKYPPTSDAASSATISVDPMLSRGDILVTTTDNTNTNNKYMT